MSDPIAKRRDVPHEVMEAVETAIKKQIKRVAPRGLYYPDLEAHLGNLGLQAAGVLDYEYRLDAGRQAFLDLEAEPTRAIVEAIAATIASHLP